jgi:helicase MOV-10
MVKFNQRHRGRYEDRVDIILEDVSIRQRFVITRSLRVTVGNKEDHELLKPRAPYVPRKRTRREPETEILPGVEPASLRAIPWVVPLPHADIPKNLSSILSQGSFTQVIGTVRRVLLPQALSSATYNRHFQSLLWIEEHRME